MTATEEDRLLELEKAVNRMVGILEGRETRCVDHGRRLERLEIAVGKQSLLSAIIGGLSAGLVMAGKAIVSKGG